MVIVRLMRSRVTAQSGAGLCRLLARFAGVSLLLVLAFTSIAPAAAQPSRPNIVFILADDLGYGDLGCQNPDSRIQTPNLDRLASQGMRFTDAHASAALCTPSRYSILTGQYCWRTRLKSGVLNMWSEPLIPAERLTVARFLQENGYRTACFGKWHLGLQWPFVHTLPPAFDKEITPHEINWGQPVRGGPVDHGFDYYFGVNMANDPPYAFIQNDRVLGRPDTLYSTVRGQQGHWGGPGVAGWNWSELLPSVTTNAVNWIKANSGSDTPFFIYFAMTGPHRPVAPSPAFIGTSRAGIYGDFVQELDSLVGEVLGALESTGTATNTLVIFTSDNGPDEYAYPRILTYDHFSMGPLRGIKSDAWEGGHRVPFIARWPGKIAPGTVNSQTICLSDFMRTAGDIIGAGIPTNAAEDSVSFLPLLLGSQNPTRSTLVLESGIGQFGLRADDWMYINSETGDGHLPAAEPPWFRRERGDVKATGAPALLYQLSQDLPETHNLFFQQNAVADLMREELLRQRGKVTWTGGRSPAWTDPANWLPAFEPTKADIIYSNNDPFHGYLQLMGEDFEINSLTLASGLTNTVTIAPGGPYELGIWNGIDMEDAAADLVLRPTVRIQQSQSWIVPAGRFLSARGPVELDCPQLRLNGSGDVSFLGGLSGPGGLIIRNSGNTDFRSPSSFSGGVEISGGGVVIVGADSALGSGPIAIPNQSTLELDAGVSLTNESLTLSAGSTVRIRVDSTYGTFGPVLGLNSVHYGGTLVLVDSAKRRVAPGQRFHLFAAAQASGNFRQILPKLTNIEWWFDPSTGVLTAVDTATSKN